MSGKNKLRLNRGEQKKKKDEGRRKVRIVYPSLKRNALEECTKSVINW